MFTRARLKLTAWYLLIIMTVSLSFSAFIYRSVNIEFQSRLDAIERRLQLRAHGILPPSGQDQFFLADIEEARERVLAILVYTNFAILVISGAAGYFLAGRTLAPIEDAMDEQKRFVADASHELKTPLTAMQTSTEVALRDKHLPLKEARKVLSENLKDIGSLSQLTNNLLSLARYQYGNHFKVEPVNLKEIIKEAVRQVAPIAKKKGVKLSIKLKNVQIKGDKESLEKLVTILMDNAVKYTPKGGGVMLNITKKRRRVEIAISDTGIGIKTEDLQNLFERFYRADSSRTKNDAAGFGLGLSIAKRIAELHGGEISAKSTVGKGSTFTVALPL